MKTRIEFDECLKDSPKFRQTLEEEEQNVENLEEKLQRVIKMCSIAVDSGKEYVKNQSAFATSLWDLQQHFQDEKAAHNALGKIIHCLQEINKYHTILLDQASRTVLKNLTTFVKSDVKTIKDSKQHFFKVSETLDSALNKNAAANKNRPQETTESDNYLIAVRSCFRHISLDYVKALTMLQSKKKPEILSTLLSYIQACSTYYHQGSDLCEDFDPFFKALADDISSMRTESNQLSKMMEIKYTTVNKIVEDKSNISNAKDSKSMEGYLFKRTTKGFKTWNRRWFFMKDNQLLYKKRTGEVIPTVMEEDLRLCTVRPALDVDRRFCFEVISLNKSHMLQAETEDMLQAWISALQKEIGAAIQHDTISNRDLNSHLFHNSPSHHHQANKKINLEQFLKIPGNSKCCDCNSLEPRWASINLGLTLCIACSGVHRSLGVHYSKVRSLTLDAWEPEIVKVMAELGNSVINKIYEANYDESIERATANCDQNVREAWIKAKYIHKRFVAPITTLVDLNKSLCNEDNDDEKTNMETGASQITRMPTRWSVRRRRRKTKNKVNNEKQHTPLRRLNFKPPLASEDEHSETESLKDGISDNGEVLIIGNNLNEFVDESALSLCSDQESTSGEDGNIDEEEMSMLNPDILLYKAAAAHNLPVMCQALAMGGDKNWTNEMDNGRKPLHQAVLSGSVMSCEFLLLNGARIDAVDMNGYSALHLATTKGSTAQAYLFLKHRARHDIIATDGKQPIDIAVEQANADIVTLLRLTQLNEEIGITEQGSNGDETYNDVMKDFSNLAINQPHRLQRPKTDDST